VRNIVIAHLEFELILAISSGIDVEAHAETC